jgi:hypothetical protein
VRLKNRKALAMAVNMREKEIKRSEAVYKNSARSRRRGQRKARHKGEKDCTKTRSGEALSGDSLHQKT